MPFSVVQRPAVLATPRTPAVLLRSRKRLESLGAEHEQGPLLNGGNSRSVIGLLFLPWHRNRLPSKLFLVEQIPFKYGSVTGDEAAPCVLGNLEGGGRKVALYASRRVLPLETFPALYIPRHMVCL